MKGFLRNIGLIVVSLLIISAKNLSSSDQDLYNKGVRSRGHIAALPTSYNLIGVVLCWYITSIPTLSTLLTGYLLPAMLVATGANFKTFTVNSASELFTKYYTTNAILSKFTWSRIWLTAESNISSIIFYSIKYSVDILSNNLNAIIIIIIIIFMYRVTRFAHFSAPKVLFFFSILLCRPILCC